MSPLMIKKQLANQGKENKVLRENTFQRVVRGRIGTRPSLAKHGAYVEDNLILDDQ